MPQIAEAGFPVATLPGGGYDVGPVKEGVGTGFGIKPIEGETETDVFHTHPEGDPGTPSTPKTTMGEMPDTTSAIKSGVNIYVISWYGLSMASPTGPLEPKYGKNNSPWIIQGNGIQDWLKKLKNKCL
jgi:hypothetical protein